MQLPRMLSFAWFDLRRRIYRWNRLHKDLSGRLRRLKALIGPIPRAVGVAVGDLDPALEDRIAPFRKPDCEVLIGQFDQDGGIVSHFGPITGAPTIDERTFVQRLGCPVALVDLNGRLGVRKEFRGALGRFVQELEAMLALEQHGCAVPRIMNVDWENHAITMTFVPGDVVRELLAQAGAPIRDRDAGGAYTRAVDRERVRTGRQFVPQVLSAAEVSRIARALDAIHSAGFVLEDVKFGNVILSAGTREPVFVDLERALPIHGLSPGLARHLRHVDLRKFKSQFGDVPAE